MGGGTVEHDCCRILVVGANRQKVQTALSLIDITPSSIDDYSVILDFIPCVATFGSYQRTDNNGDCSNVRYLVSIKAFSLDGEEPRSLLPIFDAAVSPNALFPPIAGVAIGSGIEGESDTDLIRTFVLNMMRCQDTNVVIPVSAIEPNQGFASMKEELQFYRDLLPEEKATATKERTMGPGKMASFVTIFSLQIIRESISKITQECAPISKDKPKVVVADGNNDNNDATAFLVDRNKPRYLCRKCRTVLFGCDSLLEHEPAQHNFSYRKQHELPFVSSQCQSIFLDKSLPWMGDTDANEGKFSCPKCRSKLGGWNWSGAQCSCGTWVVPAIQIPRSRVDVYESSHSVDDLPPGTVLSSLLLSTRTTAFRNTV